MRHNNKINHLGKKSAHRKAMLSNMAISLIMHKRIKTTVPKAKALRMYIEPILTKSKEDSTASRRLAFGYLQDKNAVAELFREVSPKITGRPGGYTRILKIGTRPGDASEMCYIELVDFNESMLAAKTSAEAKTTRRGRRGPRKKAEGTAEEPKAAKSKAKEPVAAAESEPVQAAEATEETRPVDDVAPDNVKDDDAKTADRQE